MSKQPDQQSQDKPRRCKKHDWEAIERDYRTGKFTLRELEAKHGPGYAEISRKAKKEGWSKDLSHAVQRATAARLMSVPDATLVYEVAQQVAKAEQQATKAVVEAMAEMNTQVILRHRGDLRQARDTAMDLLAELRGSMFTPQEKALLAEILSGEGAEPKDVDEARKLVQKVLSLGSRVASMKALADAITKLHASERIAFSLDDGKDGEQGAKPPASADPGLDPNDAYLRMVQRAQ